MVIVIGEEKELIRLISGRKYNFLTEDGLYEILEDRIIYVLIKV
ncbi:hypothetical protein [Paraclostridium sordellii]|nr:hypothetical protein [Paeniclostridium sordellii]MCR1848243.1 hypothetical protein [Paeniclostridium sordellii]